MAVLTAQIRSMAAFWCCIALAASAGCRNLDNAQVDVLERELRQQEDYIYELEDYLVEYSEKLRQARIAQCDPATPAKKSENLPIPRGPLREPTLDEDPITRPTLPMNGRNKPIQPTSEAPPAATLTTPPTGDAPEVDVPATDAPTPEPLEEAEPEPVNPRELEPPGLEIGPGVGSTETQDSRSVAAAPVLPPDSEVDAPLLIPDPIDYQADVEGPADNAEASTAPQNKTVAEGAGEPLLAAPAVNTARLSAERLQIRRVFAEPGEGDKPPGSLLVVVEALNPTDEPVDAIGAASIMIMVNDSPGSFQRVARWDFTAEETAAAWQSSHLGDGLHLELPLENSDLPEGELQLWARVVDDSGAKLLTPANQPYRFETANLASMADAAQEAVLASTEAADPTQAVPQPAATTAESTKPIPKKPTAAAEAPKPQWRASAVRLDKDRVEGYATTASGERGAWATKPLNEAQPRVASAAGAGDRPVWKRSASATSETLPAWTPER